MGIQGSKSTKKSYDYLFKLLLIGDSGIGKTEILRKFSDDLVSNTFPSTIGIDFKIKVIELNGKKIKLQIWDTAGQERFNTVTSAYYRGAMGIMLVYNITNQKSFDNVTKWLKNIDENTNKDDVERILIGNNDEMEHSRQVSFDAGQQLANQYGMQFMEIAPKNKIDVDHAFHALVEPILTKTLSQPTNQEDRISTS